jgi:hypothetical protein
MSRGPASWKSSDVAWRGGKRPYDLLKEVTVSFIVVVFAVVALSLLFASPDPPPVTFKEWATAAPKDFARTTVAEITRTSLSATYGPPYQSTAQNGSTQGFGPLSPETWFGEAIPVDTWADYVVTPLRTLGDAAVDAAIATWDAADAKQQNDWAAAYDKALHSSTATGGDLTVADGDYGPLPTLVDAQAHMARTGALDAALLYTNASTLDGGTVWYSNDQTRALLYFGDSGGGGGGPDCISPGQSAPKDNGCWYYNLAVDNSAPRFGGYLAGDTWGVVNEVGNWPGAWWLFPYSFWYQWGPGLTSPSADLYAMIATAAVSLPFLFLPWIPGLRDIPRVTRVYRVMWGDYYAMVERRRRRPGEGDQP